MATLKNKYKNTKKNRPPRGKDLFVTLPNTVLDEKKVELIEATNLKVTKNKSQTIVQDEVSNFETHEPDNFDETIETKVFDSQMQQDQLQIISIKISEDLQAQEVELETNQENKTKKYILSQDVSILEFKQKEVQESLKGLRLLNEKVESEIEELELRESVELEKLKILEKEFRHLSMAAFTQENKKKNLSNRNTEIERLSFSKQYSINEMLKILKEDELLQPAHLPPIPQA